MSCALCLGLVSEVLSDERYARELAAIASAMDAGIASRAAHRSNLFLELATAENVARIRQFSNRRSSIHVAMYAVDYALI